MTTNVRELMLAGAHYGHRARLWNPKMAPYIYSKYNKIHIFNLDHTVLGLNSAAEFLKSIVTDGGKVLYLNTKTVAADAIEDAAKSVGMPFLNKRWLGGMLTNFKITRQSVHRLNEIEEKIDQGVLKEMTKKEGMKIIAQRDKLDRAIGGVREMDDLPDALFVIDAGWHSRAISEAKKLGIPVVAVVDSNHNPDGIDYVVPGNDDSRQAIGVYIRVVTDAIHEGKRAWEDALAKQIREAGEDAAEDGAQSVMPARGGNAVQVTTRTSEFET